MRRIPAQQTTGPYRIAMVCLGNICRSPMADRVMNAMIEGSDLAGLAVADSCGTASWHTGKPMDPRSAQTLEAAGYDSAGHKAQPWTPAWTKDHDLVLAMDRTNLADLGGLTERIRPFREWDCTGPGGEVPDPYYGGQDGFEEVLGMVERTCRALLDDLRAALITHGDPAESARR